MLGGIIVVAIFILIFALFIVATVRSVKAAGLREAYDEEFKKWLNNEPNRYVEASHEYFDYISRK